MRIPKYWAEGVKTATDEAGETYKFSCWQWSDISVAEAQTKADDRAAAVVQKMAAGETLGRYGYGDRPMREETRQVIAGPANRELAIVTRNAYGALVLNAAKAMFIDIDFPEEGSVGGGLRRLFGGRAPNPEETHVQRVTAWAARRPDLGLRIYRTFGGLRCLVTNVPFDPAWPDSQAILQDLQSDPLYIRLCQAQECFRARLTPKPWRIGVNQRPPRYPWPDTPTEMLFRNWESQYDAASAQYTVCRLLKEVGPREVHPEIAPVLNLHDQLACSMYNLNLA